MGEPVAYILDCDYLTGGMPDGEPLELERRATVLRLARSGHEQALKSWKRYAESAPGEAELVVKHVDGTLTKSRPPKPQKAKRSRSLGKSAAKVTSREAIQKAMLAEWANDPDPGRREAARAALAKLGSAR